MAKLSHFWKWQIGRFWYFDVSKESGETKSCFSGFSQIGELAPVRLNPSWSESRTPPSSSGIPKYHPDQLKHPFRHPKTKKTQPDTNRQCQMSSNTLRHPLKMHDWVRLEPILHFGKTVKVKTFSLLRPQNIKTSLSTISKNDWVLPFFLFFMSVRKKLQFTVFLDHPVRHLQLFLQYIFSPEGALIATPLPWYIIHDKWHMILVTW